MAQNFPKGILPDGIRPPPGTDIMQFCRDLAESGADFAEQFDRNSDKYHNGITTAVPLGGERIPDSMAADPQAKDWRAMPDAPLAIEEDFGPDYHKAMDAYKQLNDCKKAISVLNKPVEMAMRVRHQYIGAEGDERTALLGRLKGAENDRDGALEAATEIILKMSDEDISERTRSIVSDVKEQGRFEFKDKERFGEYVTLLQRANQTIFADQKKLLQRIKDIKKAYKTTVVVGAPEAANAAVSEEAAGGA
eukprot:TRINITY_DN74155_c0_g1_i1.p1 TRINITY_DN74155_c0_g1~~TRINITY_DN74155_c0_g1_i1.p1  ORF type:complete len:270 (-),score=73.88 TRINITY_DN74155_c0_g1_i1:83-832(-)